MVVQQPEEMVGEDSDSRSLVQKLEEVVGEVEEMAPYANRGNQHVHPHAHPTVAMLLEGVDVDEAHTQELVSCEWGACIP